MAKSDEFYRPISGNVLPRFSGPSTFMRLPQIEDPAGLDIALLGIPWDGGTTNRAGARHGPREIRNMSTLMRNVHHVSRISPYTLCQIADVGDVPVNPIDVMDSLGRVETFVAKIHAAGARPLFAGGDHLCTLPVMRAIAKDRPVGMVHFDAHSDTWDAYFARGSDAGSKYTHGTPFRRAVEEGLLDPKRTIQIGLRGSMYNEKEMAFAEEAGMRLVYIEELYEIGVAAVIAEARRVVGDGPTYVSFDVDGLDPVYAPGTGTPEIGGFSTHEAQQMIRGLQGLDLVGGDVVEVAPPFDPSGNTALVGATIMYEIMCVMADAIARRGSNAGPS
ncbi:MAG: agmatinase [Alphaproteobacteria bacterium]|nr:agmatinase [Alphaproteobacteria bacterium]